MDYEQGEIVVKGYKDEKVIGTGILKSSGAPAKIVAITDKKEFYINKKDLAHIEINVEDNNGNLVYEATNELEVKIEGPAVLLGLESGDLSSHEDYKANKRKVYNGRMLAYVQASGQPGCHKSYHQFS